MIWMMAAFVLGEVWQAESNQSGVKLGILGILLFGSIFCVVRVCESQSRRAVLLEAGFLVLFFGIGFLRMREESRTDLLLQEKTLVTAEGTLYKIGKTSYYKQYYLKDVVLISKTGERIKTGAVQLSVKAEEVSASSPNQAGDETEMYPKIGNRIAADGMAEIPKQATNPGEFDWYRYYRALGIRYQIKSEAILVLDRRIDWISEGLRRLKERLKLVYQMICTETDYGIFCAVLLGEKQDLDAEVKSLYEKNGISHILAISGLHISLIGLGFYHFLRKWFGFLSSQIVAGLIMAAYVVMTGAGVSTVRAYAMFLLLLTAAVLGRTYDSMVSAGWIAFLLLFRNPYLIYYAGFLLSFGAIVGISAVGTVLSAYVGSRNVVWKAMISSMSVTFVTLPISSYFFFTYAAWSIILNLAVIPCMTLVMLSGMLGGLFGCFVPALGAFGIGMGHYILCFYEKLCLLAEKMPYPSILIGRPKWWQIGFYYGIVGGICIWANWQSNKKAMETNKSQREAIEEWFLVGRRIVLLGGVLFLCIGVLCCRRGGRLEVTFLDVSQGDGIFLRMPSGAVCLIDGGSSDVRKVGEYRILPFLQSERVAYLDFVFISHVDQDHISGIKEILEGKLCKIKTLCLPDIDKADEAYLELVQMAKQAGSQVVFLKGGDRIEQDDLIIQCVHPSEKMAWADRNSYSMVLWMRYKEANFLFTGDIGEVQEQQLLPYLPRNVTVLKVAHHGSQYSSSREFLEWVKPEYAVISCGMGNTYGHPHKEALERMAESGAKIWMTQDGGAVMLASNGRRWNMQTFLYGRIRSSGDGQGKIWRNQKLKVGKNE